VKLMDFGLAKKVVDEDGTEQEITAALTREGTTLGTVSYMSPEQLRGKTVDTRTDIFSFGIILYELLSGVHPFRRTKQAETMGAILHEEPSPLSRYSEDSSEVLQHTFTKMLAKDPDDRYQSVHEVRTNLKKLSEKLSAPDVIPAQVKAKRRIWLAAAALVVVLVAVALGIYYFRQGPASTEAPIDSIAVVPFTSAGEDEDSASLADGIPAAISSSLMRLERLKVKPAAVLIRYKGKEIDPQTVADEQSVRAVLMGNVARRGDTVAVEVYLIDGRDATGIWGERYSRQFGGIFTLEDDIARQVSEALRVELTDEESERLSQHRTTNPEAYQAFLRGKYNLGRSATDREQKSIYANAIHYFEKAIEIDPRYQEAYASLSGAYFHRARTTTLSEEDYAKAREYGEKLIEVDDSAALAHSAKALILWMYDRKWKEADREYARARELDPTLKWSAGFLMWLGRREEALAGIESWLEQADSLSTIQQGSIGWGFLFLREFDRAAEQANKVLALEPESFDAYTILGEVYQQLGMEERAFEPFAEAQRIWGVADDEVARLREVFEKSGWQGIWRWQLERVLRGQKTPRPEQMARFYVELGEKDKAFEWLEKAWSTPLWGDENAPSCYYWDSLRDDPRFEQLLRKQNLPEEAIQRHLALR
jgi:TolB-like protein/Tfp pilus assembly protein PilF